jgi:outer membrane protein TolC
MMTLPLRDDKHKKNSSGAFMSSKYLITLPVVAVMALTGCETSNTSGLEALDNTVLEMTRTDVTQRSNGTSSRPNIDYQELGYRTALRASVLASPDFHAALQRFRESEAGIQVAQSGTRPQLSGGATAGAIGGGDRSEVETGLAANLSLSQLVFDGGQTRANIAGATAQAYSARARIDITGNDVAMRAAMAWRDLWQATTQLGMLQEQISEAEGLLQKIQRLISSGIIDRAAFAAGQRQLLDLKLEQERLQASKRDAQQRLNRYFGSQPASVTAPERLFTDAELARFVENWQNAPALIAAAAELISAERAVDAARAEGRPNVSVQAGAQTPLDRDDTADGNVGVVVRHVFMDGGRRAAQLTQRERALAAAQETFESQKDELFVEAQTALSRLRSLRASVSVLQAQIKELETERDTLRSQIASGQADLRQLVETEVTFYRTRARLIEIRGDIADLELKIVAGAGQLPERLGIGIEALLVSQQ